MSKDEKETTSAEAPKKSKKMLMIIVIAVVVLAGGGAGAFFMLKGDSAEAKTPEKGVVTAIDEALTINLKDAHYLKLAFTIQLTEAAGEEAPDNSEAIDIAIDMYSGKDIAELQTEKGRIAMKEELLKKIEEAYYNEEEKTQVVMDLYFTQFVIQ